MASVNRSEVIDLLDRLGTDQSDRVLDAARMLHTRMSEAGLTWDQLLRAETDIAFGGTGATQSERVDVAPNDNPAARPSDLSDGAEAARLIDSLLARTTISETLREDLTTMKANIAKGEFDAMDARYVSALAKRLDA